MIEESVAFPTGFYVAAILFVLGLLFAWKARRSGTGIPTAAVLGTIGIWYFGDALYNDYTTYALLIGEKYLEAAWWQVALFIASFTMMVPLSGLFSGDENEKKLNYYAVGMAIVGALAVVMTYVLGTLENEVSLVYLIGFMAYQWVANYWRQGRY